MSSRVDETARSILEKVSLSATITSTNSVLLRTGGALQDYFGVRPISPNHSPGPSSRKTISWPPGLRLVTSTRPCTMMQINRRARPAA